MSANSEVRDCIVKLLDDHGVEHSVKIRATRVYEAALKGLARLEKVGWESDGSVMGTVWRAYKTHGQGQEMLDWLKQQGKFPRDETSKEKLRALVK